jgi:hypothetical protein
MIIRAGPRGCGALNGYSFAKCSLAPRIDIHASMSPDASVAIKSEAAPHPAWGKDAGPYARRLQVCGTPWDAGRGKRQGSHNRTAALFL